MIAPLPAVQRSIKRAYRHIHKNAKTARWQKSHANRRYRRVLNQTTHRMAVDPERFYAELFDAPSLSGRDID